MATKQTPPATAVEPGAAMSAAPDMATAPAAAPTPTPENAPVPGGGRWRWDIAKPGWVDLDATDAAESSVTPQPSAVV